MSRNVQTVVFDEPSVACPKCQRQSKRHSFRQKTLKGLHGVVYEVRSSVHFCPEHRFFTNVGLAYAGKTYADEVRRVAIDVFNHTERQKDLVENILAATGLEIPLTTIYEWV